MQEPLSAFHGEETSIEWLSTLPKNIQLVNSRAKTPTQAAWQIQTSIVYTAFWNQTEVGWITSPRSCGGLGRKQNEGDRWELCCSVRAQLWICCVPRIGHSDLLPDKIISMDSSSLGNGKYTPLLLVYETLYLQRSLNVSVIYIWT